ncbi:neuraminidase-like domain-containing protein [Pseudomonas orientalis]|uniref:Tc toxin subunit A-related protein n=1 Tax=Pseudomonas orientalis TaxID=76758 RepID=UPI000F566C44|nr:neuraminidase-like domain-containing protein [Pseudomonas orientalis]AZE89384.1 hypothetical protein C4J97_2683 [Pseudomonas orientalis]
MSRMLSSEAKQALSDGDAQLLRFHSEHPDFDLLHFDFHKTSSTTSAWLAQLDPLMRARLQQQQRLARITTDGVLGSRLQAAGFDSAHRIANVPEHRFLREYGHLFEGDLDMARALHRRACGIKGAVKHLHANLHSMLDSPHFGAMVANQVSPGIEDYFSQIPSYQDLFGSLNYCKCRECESIFGPAAYFLDLMRITDDYITDPNSTKSSGNIPAGYQLAQRRPDLFDLPLTCANTDTPIATLDIVNQVLSRQIGQAQPQAQGQAVAGAASSLTLAANASSDNDRYSGMWVLLTAGTGVNQLREIAAYDCTTKIANITQQWSVTPDATTQYTISNDPFQTLATAPYPFNLPANLPLAEIRSYLGALKSSLPDIYTALLAPLNRGVAQAASTDTLVLDASASTVDNAYLTLTLQLVAGPGVGQVRQITGYVGASRLATVDRPWLTQPDAESQYVIVDELAADREVVGLSIEQYRVVTTPLNTNTQIAPYYGYQSLDLAELSRVVVFQARTCLSWDQLQLLLVQGLSTDEQAAGLANTFFINNTGENLPPMAIEIDDSNVDAPYYRISHTSLPRMDRLNRFIRLAAALNWDYVALDWAMKSINALEIDQAAIKAMAAIQRLQASTGQDVVGLCSFWADMKSIGKGDGPTPADLFDRTFNNPALLNGENPYASVAPTPFDPARPLTWTIADNTGQNGSIRARLVAALACNDDDLTRLGLFVNALRDAPAGTLTLNLGELTWLYRLAKAAAIFELTIDEYLLLQGLLYFPGKGSTLPTHGVLQPTVGAVLQQKHMVDWLNASPFTVYSALYVLSGVVSPYFTPAYRPDDIAPFVQNLATVSAPSLLTPQAFVLGSIDAPRLYTKLVQTGFFSAIGVLLNQASTYRQAAAHFPLSAQSFVTADIPTDQADVVYQNLVNALPPLLLPLVNDAALATVSQKLSASTDLSFLFTGESDAPNKRNQVLSVLLATQGTIYFTEFAFALPMGGDQFVSRTIDPVASARALRLLSQHTPSLVTLDPAAGQRRDISAYDGATRQATLATPWAGGAIPGVSSLYAVWKETSQGAAQAGSITSLTLAADSASDNAIYVGMTLRLTAGAGTDQQALILAYDGATHIATVGPAWVTLPDATTTYSIQQCLVTGVAVSASTGTLTLQASASATSDAYKGCTVEILLSGLLSSTFSPSAKLDFLFVSQGAGQHAAISTYDGPSRTATITAPWAAKPDGTTCYQVVQFMQEGTSMAASSNSLTLAADASDVDGAYNGMTLRLTGGSGQASLIYSYDGATHTATLQAPWANMPEASSPYAVVQIVTQGSARGGSATTLALDAAASSEAGAYLDMTLELLATPAADARRGEVKQNLLSQAQSINHTAQTVVCYDALQQGNAMQALGDLLGTTAERLAALIPVATQATDLDDYLDDLLTPLIDGQVEPGLPPFIASLARGVVAFECLAFNTAEILAVGAVPQAFGISDPQQLTLDDLATFSLFKGLVRQFDNKSASLIDYLRRPPDATLPGPTTLALSTLSHWPVPQIVSLERRFWPPLPAAKPMGPGTVRGLARLNVCFVIGASTGLEVSTLLRIDGLGYLPAADAKGIIAANWRVYIDMARATQAAVNAKFGNGDFGNVNSDLSRVISQQRRDALLGYTIWLLQQTYPQIDSADALYTYLLIDVQMCGCDTTSYIAQGIAAVQLYMQRCRLMLEPGVTDLSNIPDVWWQWMSAYRVWEANRKIFLYPENYLEPALRSKQTPEFKDLVDALMQTDISEKSVSQAYQGYFQGVNAVAGLTNASAYSCRLQLPGTSVVHNQGTATGGSSNSISLVKTASPYFGAYTGMRIVITAGKGANQVNLISNYDGMGQATVAQPWTTVPDNTSVYVITGRGELETLFLAARSNTEPALYYTRSHDGVNGWTPWLQAKISIAAPYVTPIYAFNRLNLFWAEQQMVDGSRISSDAGNATSTTITDVSASLKVSFQDSSGGWIAPQTLASNIVVTYNEAYKLDKYVSDVMVGYSPLFNPKLIFWKKPYPLYVPPVKYTQPTVHPNGEQIFLNYGFGVSFAAGGPLPQPTAPTTAMPASKYQIESNAYSMVQRFNNMVAAPIQYVTGFLPFQQSLTLSSSMVQSRLNTALINNPPGVPATFPQPYVPALVRSSGQFGVSKSSTWNIMQDNYQCDDYPAAPLATSSCEVSLLNSVFGATASVVTVKNSPGAYLFDNGDEAFLVRASDPGLQPISDVLLAQASNVPFPDDEFYLQTQAYTATRPAPALDKLRFAFDRITTTLLRTLNQRLLLGGIPELLSVESQLTPEPPFSRLGPNLASVIAPPSDSLDFYGAYGLYFWEIFFHAPFLVADSLHNNQRYAEAKQWYEYIFNPTQQPEGNSGDDADRFWRFLPFRTMNLQTLTQILTDPAQIAAYNHDPFDPDAIARLRTSAYAKAIVMKYIDNLLGWGDLLFAQDTRESINQATNLYVLANELLGPRPVATGNCAAPAPMSYNDVKQEYSNRTIATGTVVTATPYTLTLARPAPATPDAYAGYYVTITAGAGIDQTRYIIGYDAAIHTLHLELAWNPQPDSTSQYRVFANGIPEFLIRMENTPMVLAPQVQGAFPGDVVYGDVPFNDINSYFCIPENSELTAYWDLVDDRLFKIRHCMNMAGQVRTLALFEPPIDPRDLIQAARASAGSSSLAASFSMPIPYYRFASLIERAKGLTAAVSQLGAQLLSTLEKRDGEALALLRNAQENTLLQMTTLVKQQQVDESSQAGLALNQSLLSAQKRQSWYTDQIDRGLSSNEIQNIVYMTLATVFNTSATAVRTMASIGYAVPQVGSPFAMTYGGAQLGSSLTAASGVLDGLGILANFGAQLNLTMAQYRRRESEWQLQSDLASYDVAQIQFQIAGNAAQQKIAARDLEVQQTSLAQNAVMDAFLKNKFTNEELYQWMAARLSVLYFQTYQLALELSRSVQRAYQYELNSDTSFINFGYWDGGRRGLLAGEGLMLALNQMEKSYLDRNGRTLEIEKTVSLLQLNPRAVLDLIETGECLFELPEKMFSDDFPGHYLRKIKSVAVSIPAITGPYQNLHATLTQLSSQILIKPDVNGVNYLLGASDATLPDSSVLRSNWWANQSVVLSRGMFDSGLFEGSGADDRYLPFEGTGAVSTWRVSLPFATNLFDFRSITDVLLQLRYTAVDGGAKLRQDVVRLPFMRTYAGSDFLACAQRFSSDWYQFLEAPTAPARQTLAISLSELTPDHVTKAVLTGFYLQLVTPASVDPSSITPYIQVQLGKGKPVSLALDRQGKGAHFFAAAPRMIDIEGPASITFDLTLTPQSLKVKTGPQRLDPAVVQNLVLILFYEGEIRWS